ncbi:hypothetical protein EU92_0666 [Prochlorococcus marinus str. MIT 9107]|uniref:Uncharacterized protein n=1 Tax=Prochlorococcus marinus str. MIT 9116 TaxID=167544 RepID=A0A0A1ZUZ8_PROMR|nr:hypothetical protein EU92_0666 [Prochlorococcus marinus str. MIT 9107]KGF92064.1 hypothetical protein EU93_0880 [Prochlorococcus marinus str. MIT 9116]KGF93445.1 hypothetical protein EU94_1601 [Prochlorococcus marinus str. MIT 9123]
MHKLELIKIKKKAIMFFSFRFKNSRGSKVIIKKRLLFL